MNETELKGLCARLLNIKQREDQAKAERIRIEGDIAVMLATKSEGTDSARIEGYKITVTSKLTRVLDYSAYLAIEKDIPETVRCIDLEPKLNMKKLRAMEMVRPGFSAQFVTTKPAKTAVKIEVVA